MAWELASKPREFPDSTVMAGRVVNGREVLGNQVAVVPSLDRGIVVASN